MDLSVLVTAFVCDGCDQQQIGEPAAALCGDCERKREAHEVLAGGGIAAAKKVLLDELERGMRVYLDRLVMRNEERLELVQVLDRMLDHVLKD